MESEVQEQSRDALQSVEIRPAGACTTCYGFVINQAIGRDAGRGAYTVKPNVPFRGFVRRTHSGSDS